MIPKKWDADVIGILAPEAYVEEKTGRQSIFINGQDSLQLYVKIMSDAPMNFPSDVTLVTAYTSDILNSGFEDPYTTRDERIEALREFLAERIIVFQPTRKQIPSGQDVYGLTEARVQMRPPGFTEGSTYSPIPIFSEEKHGTQVEFEEKLNNNRFVGRIDHISHEPDDTPSFVLWKTRDSEYFAYGMMDGHRYAQGGFAFKINGLHRIEFNETWFDEAIEEGDVLFVSTDIYREIEAAISKSHATREKEVSVPVSDVSSTETDSKEPTKSESEFLDGLYLSARERGLLFDERDLINFHTAMKTSNLVILAGMSGTGKSRLVEVYARALGLSPSQVNFISVRPSWTDDADLLGYLDTRNYLYRPGDTGLIETLRHADENPNQIHIVCFDEMNLARVEHYFSQFLSVLEAPTPRRLHLYNEQLASRLYNATEYPPIINIGDNVMFVGTVNLDESTYHFSDKVLDRANVISLRVLPFSRLKDLKIQPTPRKTWNVDDFQLFRNRSETVQLSDREVEFLEAIHHLMSSVSQQRGVGYRIVRQIDMYLKGLPNQEYLNRNVAFDLQVTQRIITKVRGAEEELRSLLGQYDSGALDIKHSAMLDLFDKFSDVSSFDYSRTMVNQKAKELKLYGYAV